ncbi:MAG: amidohydrolase [Theionarchaea archaeon]|nr:amidohydrolase [Theionarchaea archaeon]
MDLVIYNGTILTMSKESARAVSVDRGRIQSMEKAQASQEIDLEGKTLIPGFIDCHTHFKSMGMKLFNVDLSRTASADQAIALLEKKASRTEKGKWILGFSWDESFWSERRFLTPEDLSGIENPVCAIRVDGHMAVLNEAAQKELGVQQGYLYEDELFRLYSRLPEEDTEKALEAALELAHHEGVTSIHDNPMDVKTFLFYQKRKDPTLRIYVNLPVSVLDEVNQIRLRTGFGNEWLKFGGIKIFTDGSIGAKTAAMSFNYRNEDNNGLLVYTDSELLDIMKRAYPNQVAVHAIGDRAIQQVITCSQRGGRNRIEHAELVRDDQIPLIKELGLILSMQPNFLQWSHPDGLYDIRFGTGIDNRFQLLKKAGIPLVFGSDCMPFSPLYGIEQVLKAPFEEQRLSIKDALAMYTRNGAVASFEENIKGTIKKGNLADFVILSEDPREVDISKIAVEMTIVGGKVVYSNEGLDSHE